MRQLFWKKITESALSVLPVFIIVLLLPLFPDVSLTGKEILTFFFSALFLVLGISLFNLGADLAMTPMGEYAGSGLSHKVPFWATLLIFFSLGVVITVVEPDLSVLAGQVEAALSPLLLITVVGIGVGLFLVFAVLRTAHHRNLSELLFFCYLVLFSLAALVVVNGNGNFLPLSFDSGGVTTGPITVPFLMALGVGTASSMGGKHSKDNSFGLIALCSVGPVLAVLLTGVFSDANLSYEVAEYSLLSAAGILHLLLQTAKEVGVALGLLVLFFLLLNFFFLKLPIKKICNIALGIAFTYFGLVVFLTAVQVGFIPIGYQLGEQLAQNPVLLVLCGVLLGAAAVLAEPAVQVLNRQVEEITGGLVSKRSMLIALCIGVGISIGLSMLRTALHFNILFYLIPGYILSLGLSFFVPPLYTAIAFDSGGVASGPLTSSFILPFAIGACCALQGAENVMTDAFGVVAMVAMTPLITIQLLGFRAVLSDTVRRKIAMKRILSADDEQIVRFL